MRWFGRLAPFLLALFVVLVPAVGRGAGPADALPASSTTKVRDTLKGAAREAFDRASLLFRAGSFSAARVEFDQAYRASGERRILYNVAVCDKELRNYARAVATLKESLRGSDKLPVDYETRVNETLALLEPLTTMLAIETQAEAQVFVDDDLVGIAPLPGPLPVDLGEHTVKVRKPGFLEARRRVAAASGAVARVEIQLTPLGEERPNREPQPPSARIRVSIDDAKARVFIDDAFIGLGTLEQQVSVGPHRIRVERAGERSEVSVVTVNANEMRTVTVESSSKVPTWIWVAGGVAVVAAVTTVVLVATRSETRFEGSSPGTLDPGVVAASF